MANEAGHRMREACVVSGPLSIFLTELLILKKKIDLAVLGFVHPCSSSIGLRSTTILSLCNCLWSV